MTIRREFIKKSGFGIAGIITIPSITSGWISANDKVKKIKIGQIGISHEHAPKITSLKNLPDVFEIVGIVDDRNSKSARYIKGDILKPYDGLKWMTEEELFNSPDLDAVMVETANTDLVPTAIRCMEHDLAIHMDKPGGEDLKHFGKLLNGCKERNLPFQMGYMYRNNLAYQFVQKAVRQGWLGDIFEIQTGMSHDYGGAAYQKYLSNFKGGIMFNLGCHPIDIVVSIMGRPEKISPFLKSTPGAANGALNNCRAVLEYPHATVTIHVCDQEVNGISNRRFKIAGTKGTIEWCPIERFDGKPLIMNLTLCEDNLEYPAGSHVIDMGVKLDRYVDQLIEFARIIRGEMQNPYTYEHDFLAQEVLLAASGYINWVK